MVFSRLYEYKIFITCIHSLQFFNLLQHHIVHAMLILSENSLCLNTYSHKIRMFLSNMQQKYDLFFIIPNFFAIFAA